MRQRKRTRIGGKSSGSSGRDKPRTGKLAMGRVSKKKQRIGQELLIDLKDDMPKE